MCRSFSFKIRVSRLGPSWPAIFGSFNTDFKLLDFFGWRAQQEYKEPRCLAPLPAPCSGHIPPEIWDLDELEHLRLADNLIKGKLMMTSPTELSIAASHVFELQLWIWRPRSCLVFSKGNSWATNRFRFLHFHAHSSYTSTRIIEISGERSPKLSLVVVVYGAGDMPTIPEKRMKKLVYFGVGTNQITGLCNWLLYRIRIFAAIDWSLWPNMFYGLSNSISMKIIIRRLRSLIEYRRPVLHPL